MGRFGKLPVIVPEGVEVTISDGVVVAKGPKGELSVKVPRTVKVEKTEEGLLVSALKQTKQSLSDQGTVRSLLINITQGVKDGWKKQLEVSGPGYRAEVRGKNLVMMLGFSHPVEFEAPEGITFSVEKNLITVEGSDKDAIGLLAAKIRDTRKPNVYTGSGIKYADEQIRRKAGKQAAAKGAA